MAQPVFDDHPLEQYLRATGEPLETMPGSVPEFMQDPYDYELDFDDEESPDWPPLFLVRAVEMIRSLFPSPPKTSQFAERFKHDVISSSLLASTLPVPNTRRRSNPPSPPGKPKPKLEPPSNVTHEPIDYWGLGLIFVVAGICLRIGLYFSALVSLGGASIYVYTHSDNAKADMTSTMAALKELITANALWDYVVQETVDLLKKEEDSPPPPVSGEPLETMPGSVPEFMQDPYEYEPNFDDDEEPLASTVPVPNTRRRSTPPPQPGKPKLEPPSNDRHEPIDYWVLGLIFVVAGICLRRGLYFSALVSLGGASIYVYTHSDSAKADMTSTMAALKELVTANALWDAVVQETPPQPGKPKLEPPSNGRHEPIDYWVLGLIFVVAGICLRIGLYFSALVSLGGASIYVYTHSDSAKADMTSTMAALKELITANALWDSVVQETVDLLEKEEDSPPSPVSGEPLETMPGSVPEFMQEPYEYGPDYDDEEPPDWPPFLVRAVEIIRSLLPSLPEASQFAERFKYDVISSSLLASTLPVPNTRRRSSPPSLPGKPKPKLEPPSNVTHEPIDYWILGSIFLVAGICLRLGLYFSALGSLGGASIYVYTHSDNTKTDMTSTMAALKELITANALWDSVVQETVDLLEKEEDSPPSPVSAIRLSMHSSLNTTQTQCDNVRHLFAALTAPVELAQLSEMYAPPSPRHSLSSGSPDPMLSKRTSWSGAHSVPRKRERRRSDLSSLLNPSPLTRSNSAPSTPHHLDLVHEDEDEDRNAQFGVAALALQRRRRVSGIETLRLPRTPPRIPLTPSSTISHASRFTTMQTMRHPLALSSLHHALDGALASKRYACSHLLALRFGDEDDEGYWEDVRSVMALLTTTFSDAAARLTEALEEAAVQEEVLGNSDPPKPVVDGDFEPAQPEPRMSVTSLLTSFAPVPTHLSRFAAHVDAISSALDDAREHLAECVAVLRDDKSPTPQPYLRRRRSRTFSLSREPQPPAEPPALQAYERLRRELGLALRECERGRDKLLAIVAPPLPPPVDAVESEEDVPSLGHDASDSDKPDPAEPIEEEPQQQQHNDAVVVAAARDADVAASALDLDDATAHLLLGTSPRHLPMPGAEQVFESQAEVGVFTRERSKLTREERIQLAKARRESGGPRLSIGVESESPKWGGPGGEVVQELKDVIWKVGERRRKMAE